MSGRGKGKGEALVKTSQPASQRNGHKLPPMPLTHGPSASQTVGRTAASMRQAPTHMSNGIRWSKQQERPHKKDDQNGQ